MKVVLLAVTFLATSYMDNANADDKVAIEIASIKLILADIAITKEQR